MAEYDGVVLIDAKIDTKNANAQMLSMENRILKATDKVSKLHEKMDTLANAKVPTEEFKEIQTQITSSEEKLRALEDRMAKWQELGKRTKSNTFKAMQYDAEELRKTIEYANEEKKELLDSGKAYVAPAETEEYTKLAEKAQYAEQELKVLCKRHDELVDKQRKASESTKTSGDVLNKFGKRVAGLAKRVLVFSLITRAFRSMVSAMKEGLQNYVQYSSEYNKTMSDFASSAATLKNSLATAAAPIINAMVPALTTLCNWLTTATNLISRFIAFLSGKSTWTRATKQQVNYAKSLKGTSEAAEKAKNSLAGFDDLDVMQKEDNAGTAGGGEVSGAGAFEEVPFTENELSLFEKVKEILDVIVPLIIVGGAALGTWKLIGFLENLMGAHPLLGQIVGILVTIAGFALMIYSYFDMWNNGVEWDSLIGFIVGVSLAVAGLIALGYPLIAGIALIVAGIAGMALAFKDMTKNGMNAKNVTLLLFSVTALLAGIFMTFGARAAWVTYIVLAVIAVFAAAMAHCGTLEEAVGYLKDAFSFLGTFLKSVFAGDWETAFKAIKSFALSILNVIIIAFESLVNSIVDGMNAMIRAAINLVNKIPGLSFSAPQIPHWSAPRIPVPALANGGITTGSTLAQIGEAGREAVLPLENNLGYLEEFADMIASKMPEAQTGPVYLQVDGKTFARLLRPYSQAENGRVGVSFT